MSGGGDFSILVVEDETPQRQLIAEILERSGYEVRDADSVEAAIPRIEEAIPDLILCDWRLPGRSGGELLEEVVERGWGSAFVVMTAYGSITHAVEAIRMGADDYLSKPFERDALLLAVKRALRTRRLEQENERLRVASRSPSGFGELIGRSPQMQKLYRTIEKVGGTDATVLIIGESGTGKELVATSLHQASRRKDKPFVAVNCAAIPETLIESELFGHERGAFTGAHKRRAGRFEEADGGTIFLDEIASMPLSLQATLLRVLQERRFSRVGGAGEVGCDVRVIAASNRDLPQMVADGQFREDLYYRLNVIPVRIPPLRERKDDVPLLARAFFQKAAEQHGIQMDPLPASILRALVEHSWPGNVRELANSLERLVLLAEDGKIDPADLPSDISGSVGRSPRALRLPPEGIDWAEMESSLLRQALTMSDGNRTKAAKLLGLSYKAFLYRLEKHHLIEFSNGETNS